MIATRVYVGRGVHKESPTIAVAEARRRCGRIRQAVEFARRHPGDKASYHPLLKAHSPSSSEGEMC